MSIGKTGHVLVRTSHSRGQLKGQRFQSSKSAMSGGLKLSEAAMEEALGHAAALIPAPTHLGLGLYVVRLIAEQHGGTATIMKCEWQVRHRGFNTAAACALGLIHPPVAPRTF
jgi:hypothetical protein